MARLPSNEFWSKKRVFVTGHKGFKGAWLSMLLSRLGATSVGFGYDLRSPLLYDGLTIAGHEGVEGDVLDGGALTRVLADSGAEIVFHLAAQPLVLKSYQDPVGTFRDNILGTAQVLEAARKAPSLRAVVVVTSDKVYRNDGRQTAYRETDALGGDDPYSASKAATELVVASMVTSFFSGPDSPAVACVRAGNVIGGGDWADHRLLPDAVRAFARGEPLLVRNPASTRPWQHVLDPLGGYLLAAETLVSRSPRKLERWNFGPRVEDAIPVREVADTFVRTWGEGASWETAPVSGNPPKEAATLAVDSSLARQELDWAPRWRVGEAVERTASWYRDMLAGHDPTALVERDIKAYFVTP